MSCLVCGYVCANELQFSERSGYAKWYCDVCKAKFIQIREKDSKLSQEELGTNNSIMPPADSIATAPQGNCNKSGYYPDRRRIHSFRDYKDDGEENIFLFKESSDRSNLINTSNIRLTDSTESLKSLPTESNFPKTSTTSSHKDEHQNSLTVESIRDFNLQRRPFFRGELVYNYLKSHFPATAFQSCAYICHCPSCSFRHQIRAKKIETIKSTIRQCH